MIDLADAARRVQMRAYAPYSGYRVGAALLDDQGRVFEGVNFENISFGLTICAERNAVGAMITGGGQRVAKLALATRDGGTPCGACLQVLYEFADPGLPILLVSESGDTRDTTLGELMPAAFHGNVNPA